MIAPWLVITRELTIRAMRAIVEKDMQNEPTTLIGTGAIRRDDLEAAYKQMAQDKDREAEALAWAEGTCEPS